MNRSSKNPNLGGENLDRLSSLPDHLLLHILSFLPTLDAVRTVAIQRFSNLWTQLDCFDFDDSTICRNKSAREERILSLSFFQLVNKVLLLHEGSKLQKFKLKIGKPLYSEYDEEWLRKLIETWICQLKTKKLQVFHYSYFTRDSNPSSRIFMIRSLVELCLEKCEIKSQRFSMQSLQLLRLTDVLLDGETFKELLHGCPMLRDLTVANCKKLRDIMFTASNIEKLEVIKTDEFYGRQVLIDCPNLKSFSYVGLAKLVAVMNLQQIQYAFIKFEDDIRYMRMRSSNFCQILQGVKHARSLTISDSHILNFDVTPKAIEAIDFGDMSVRKLTLDSVSLRNKLLNKLVLACTSLQDLSIINCSGLEEISLSIPTSEKLTLSCVGIFVVIMATMTFELLSHIGGLGS